MCVKIICQNKIKAFDTERPLEQQLDNSARIIVNYEPSDPTIFKFLREMERFSKNRIQCSATITVKDNNFSGGTKVKRQIAKLKNDIAVNELMRLAEICFRTADEKLEKLVQIIGRI